MSHWKASGKSDEWYTPAWIFEALGCRFDLDVAAPEPGGTETNVPAKRVLHCTGLTEDWHGFVWMNPPFGARNSIAAWLHKFFTHNNGIALTPDRTSAPWFQIAAPLATSILFLPKVKFERPDGTIGKSPSNGTALMAAGPRAHAALRSARDRGLLVIPT